MELSNPCQKAEILDTKSKFEDTEPSASDDIEKIISRVIMN